MLHYKYLIVGGGMASDAAVNGIREADPDGSVAIISAEANPPYDRPPLSPVSRMCTLPGDAATFLSLALGRRLRVEHEDNANAMGRAAGAAMAGKASPYHHLPFFYSDLFDLGYEAVGELDPHLETVGDWKEEHREGVVYYLREGRVRGVLLWNGLGPSGRGSRANQQSRTFPCQGSERPDLKPSPCVKTPNAGMNLPLADVDSQVIEGLEPPGRTVSFT